MIAPGAAALGLMLGGAQAADAAPTLFAGGSTAVTPIDAASGVKRAPITGFPNATSSPFTYMALSPDQKTGWFVSSSGVTPFDVASGTRGTLIPAAPGVAVAASPDGKTVYETSLASRALVPIDTATKTAGTPIPWGVLSGSPAPSSIAVSPDSSTVWVGTDAGILKIDPVAGTVSAPIVVPDRNGFGDLVVSPDGSTLFVGTDTNGIYPIDTANKSVGSLIPFPGATGAQSTLSGLALSPDGTTVYAISQSQFSPSNYVTPVTIATKTAGTSIPLNLTYVSDLAISQDGKTAYVISATGGTVESVNLTTGTIGNTTSVPAPSVGLVLASDVVASGPEAPQGTLSDTAMSGVVGDPTNPTVTLTVSQKNADGSAVDPSTLTVSATSSNLTAIPDSGVQVGGTGATRTVMLAPAFAGYSTITFTITGAGGKTSATTLDYAASFDPYPAAGARWLFGFSDASTAIDVGDGYILVADDERGQIGLFRADRSGPPIKEFPLQVASGIGGEIDYESAARAGNTIYFAGSMGNDKGGAVELSRQTVFAATITGSGADTELTYTGKNTNLRTDLVAWDNGRGKPLNLEAATHGAPKGNEGFNVEGMEFAPDSTSTAYLGFRAPIRGGKALIVPVTNFDRLLTGTDEHGTFGEPIMLDLGGRSIRELRKNSSNEYLILAGGSDFGPVGGGGEALYRWDGIAGHAPTLLSTQFPIDDSSPYDDGPMAWEGIAAVPHPLVDGSTITVLGDQGYNYLYGHGVADPTAKSLREANWRKSPVIQLTLQGVGQANQAPTVTASRTPAGDITAGDTIAFTATGTDADGDALTYAWDFADGDTSTQQNPSHQFAAAGTRAVTVTVSDGKGGTASTTLNVVVNEATARVDQSVTIGGDVPGTLALALGTAPSFGTFAPNVAKDYTAALTATVTSTFRAAALTVADPSATATGRLVNDTTALAQPLLLKAGSSAGTTAAVFAALSTSSAPLSLLTYAAPVSGDAVTIDLKQSIAGTEPLLKGTYAKTLVFTLTSTTP